MAKIKNMLPALLLLLPFQTESEAQKAVEKKFIFKQIEYSYEKIFQGLDSIAIKLDSVIWLYERKETGAIVRRQVPRAVLH